MIVDSKKLSSKKIKHIAKYLSARVLYGIGTADSTTVDNVNILEATFLAMHLALDNLQEKGGHPNLLLIDGPQFKSYFKIPHQCIIKGDCRVLSIAAVSILAKNHRDQLMQNLYFKFPTYHWNANKGYGTQKHLWSIKRFGLSPMHRKSFKITWTPRRPGDFMKDKGF